MLIGTYPIKIVLVGGIVGFIIITTAFKNIKGKFTKKDMFCSIKIIINSKSAYTEAIIDTGNFLKEPISKVPVIVVEKQVLSELIPNYILDNLDKIINGENVKLDEYISKIRLIPFSSLGRENGILLGIKVDKVLIETEEKTSILDNIIVGIYNGVLSKTGKYRALIGIELLDSREYVNESKNIIA